MIHILSSNTDTRPRGGISLEVVELRESFGDGGVVTGCTRHVAGKPQARDRQPHVAHRLPRLHS